MSFAAAANGPCDLLKKTVIILTATTCGYLKLGVMLLAVTACCVLNRVLMMLAVGELDAFGFLKRFVALHSLAA